MSDEEESNHATLRPPAKRVRRKPPRPELKEDEWDLQRIRHWLEQHPDETLALAGGQKVLRDIFQLKAEELKRIDFSGADLMRAQIGELPQRLDFNINKETHIPDTLSPTLKGFVKEKVKAKDGPDAEPNFQPVPELDALLDKYLRDL